MPDFDTECKRDEDWNSKWGPGGTTAKMMAAETCFAAGADTATVDDCGMVCR